MPEQDALRQHLLVTGHDLIEPDDVFGCVDWLVALPRERRISVGPDLAAIRGPAVGFAPAIPIEPYHPHWGSIWIEKPRPVSIIVLRNPGLALIQR